MLKTHNVILYLLLQQSSTDAAALLISARGMVRCLTVGVCTCKHDIVVSLSQLCCASVASLLQLCCAGYRLLLCIWAVL